MPITSIRMSYAVCHITSMRILIKVNIKNRPHYFFNDIISIKNFDPSFLGINKILFKTTDAVIYHIESLNISP